MACVSMKYEELNVLRPSVEANNVSGTSLKTQCVIPVMGPTVYTVLGLNVIKKCVDPV